MNNLVTIRHQISEQEWDRTVALRWEAAIFPTYYCFFGRVSFRVGDQEVLGSDQFDISIADLAVGFANLVVELRSGAVGLFKFQQSDDMLEISFQTDTDSVSISHNLSPDAVWRCRRASLEKAMVEFITSFTAQAEKRVPKLFDWRDLEILRDFSKASSEV